MMWVPLLFGVGMIALAALNLWLWFDAGEHWMSVIAAGAALGLGAWCFKVAL